MNNTKYKGPAKPIPTDYERWSKMPWIEWAVGIAGVGVVLLDLFLWRP